MPGLHQGHSKYTFRLPSRPSERIIGSIREPRSFRELSPVFRPKRRAACGGHVATHNRNETAPLPALCGSTFSLIFFDQSPPIRSFPFPCFPSFVPLPVFPFLRSPSCVPLPAFPFLRSPSFVPLPSFPFLRSPSCVPFPPPSPSAASRSLQPFTFNRPLQLFSFIRSPSVPFIVPSFQPYEQDRIDSHWRCCLMQSFL